MSDATKSKPKGFINQGGSYILADSGRVYRYCLKDSEHGQEVLKSLVTEGDIKYDLMDDSYSPPGYICYRDNDDARCQLPSGTYQLEVISHEKVFTPITVSKPQTLVHINDKLTNDLTAFIQGSDLYKQIGALYKRGYLFYGPPGTGKSTLINQIVTEIIPDDSIVIYCRTLLSQSIIKTLASDSRLKVFIFEELLQQLEDTRSDAFLSFLDGYESITNCLVLATTNHPEHLPSNIVKRPGRFDVVESINKLPKEVYKILVDLYCNYEGAWELLSTKDYLTTAHLKELGLRCALQHLSVQESYKSLKDSEQVAEQHFNTEKGGRIGFASWDDDSD